MNEISFRILIFDGIIRSILLTFWWNEAEVYLNYCTLFGVLWRQTRPFLCSSLWVLFRSFLSYTWPEHYRISSEGSPYSISRYVPLSWVKNGFSIYPIQFFISLKVHFRGVLKWKRSEEPLEILTFYTVRWQERRALG